MWIKSESGELVNLNTITHISIVGGWESYTVSVVANLRRDARTIDGRTEFVLRTFERENWDKEGVAMKKAELYVDYISKHLDMVEPL